MSMHTFSRTLTSVAVAAALSASAMADTVIDKGFAFSLGGGYNAFDTERSLTNSWGPEAGIGYRFNDRFSLEGLYSTFKTDQKNKGNARLKDYRLEAFYDLKPWDGGWTPYALMGIGELRENREFAPNRDDTRFMLGAGARKALTDNLSLRSDIRAVRSMDYHQTEGMVKVALSWAFGSAGQPIQPQQPAPIVLEQAAQPQPPMDTDKDGVVDSQDLCTATIPGATVDASGCEAMEPIELMVKFGFDTDDLTISAQQQIQKMADFMTRHPQVRIRVTGHTDSSGPEGYNLHLSQDRAERVRQALVSNYGINADRIEAVGKGESEPMADNSTLAGRQKNRRVVAEIL